MPFSKEGVSQDEEQNGEVKNVKRHKSINYRQENPGTSCLASKTGINNILGFPIMLYTLRNPPMKKSDANQYITGRKIWQFFLQTRFLWTQLTKFCCYFCLLDNDVFCRLGHPKIRRVFLKQILHCSHHQKFNYEVTYIRNFVKHLFLCINLSSKCFCFQCTQKVWHQEICR